MRIRQPHVIWGAATAALIVFAVALVWARRHPARIDRAQVVADIAQYVIVPTYATFKDRATALSAATTDLCKAPSPEALERARTAWLEARSVYKRSEAFRFGPARDLRVEGNIDFWPLRAWIVEAEIGRTEPVTKASVRSLGAPARGFPALELLLFGEPSSTIVATSETNGGRTCAYAAALATDIEATASRLLEAWQGDKGFAAEMARAGQPGSMYAKAQEALDALVNPLVALAYTIEDMKLARPLGKRHGNMAQPEAVESQVSKTSVADILANLQGLRLVLQGAPGEGRLGIEDLVAEMRPELNDAIKAAINSLEADLEAIQPNLGEAVEKDPAAVEKAFRSAANLTKIMSGDLVNVLGVTPTFSDNDGD